MTCKKKSLERALEPDECYYTVNLERMRGIRRLLLERDPPPDLVLEIDITRSSVDRMAIYAAMGVPELWRFDGKILHVYRLMRDSTTKRSTTARRSPRFRLPSWCASWRKPWRRLMTLGGFASFAGG
jgi:Uma2 family endonuclease